LGEQAETRRPIHTDEEGHRNALRRGRHAGVGRLTDARVLHRRRPRQQREKI